MADGEEHDRLAYAVLAGCFVAKLGSDLRATGACDARFLVHYKTNDREGEDGVTYVAYLFERSCDSRVQPFRCIAVRIS